VRIIPETANRDDWPRLVAQVVNALVRNSVDFSNLPDFADDAAAATGGVEVGALYRTGSVIKVRIA
jgi:hypothetical protein